MVTSVSADLCGGVCTGSYDGKVMRWDVSTGQRVATFEPPSKTPSSVVTAVACVGPFLLASYRDKKVKKLLLRTGECLYIIDKAHTCSVCCLSATDDIFATGSSDGMARVFSLENGAALRQIKVGSPVSSLLLAQGLTLFTGSDDGAVKRWGLEEESLEQEFYGHEKAITALASDGTHLWSGSKDAVVRQWSLDTLGGKRPECVRLTAQDGPVGGIVVQGDRLFVAAENVVRERSVSTQRPGAVMRSHSSAITALAISAEGNHLFSSSEDCTVCHWSVPG